MGIGLRKPELIGATVLVFNYFLNLLQDKKTTAGDPNYQRAINLLV